RDPRIPAQRAAEDAEYLSRSSDLPLGWCSLGNESYTVCPFSPGGLFYELRKDRWMDPSSAAKSWAANIAAMHQVDPRRTGLASQITAALPAELVKRCNAYIKDMSRDFAVFEKDPRVTQDRTLEATSITAWLDEVRDDSANNSRK